MKKWKCLNLWKKCLISVFLGKNFKKEFYCHIWNWWPWICFVAKVDAKIKIVKFETENASFSYFKAIILKSNCCISNLHPRNCLTANFCEKTKIPKYRTKNAWYGYFRARVFKNFCHIWHQRPQSCQKRVL